MFDGSGQASITADIAIQADRIVAVGQLEGFTAARRIDATGLAVAPGFIDIHNHSDQTLLDEPRCESMIRQGVTTMVLGEGGSAGPVKAGTRPWSSLGEYFHYVEQKGLAANIAGTSLAKVGTGTPACPPARSAGQLTSDGGLLRAIPARAAPSRARERERAGQR